MSIVVAGGVGSRVGSDVPKQLQIVAGRRILDWSVDAMAAVSDAVIVVAHPDLIVEHRSERADQVVSGGATRADSVRAGLVAAAELEPTHVLIHDAARPVASPAVVGRVIDALTAGKNAVIPVVPVTDSLRSVGPDGSDTGSVDRSGFRAVQTPQGFSFGLIERAHASGNEATDDASLMDSLGVDVAQVEGDPQNIKITVASDLALAEILLG